VSARRIFDLRSRIAWPIAFVWILTTICVVTSTFIHPVADAKLNLNVRRLTIESDRSVFVVPAENREVLFSNISSIRNPSEHLDLTGSANSTCAFYNVRSSSVRISERSEVSFLWNSSKIKNALPVPLSLSFEVPIFMTLTTQPGKSGMSCAGMSNDQSSIGSVERVFSADGGAEFEVSTLSTSTVNFIPVPGTETKQTQIPIVAPIDFWQVDQATQARISVLRTPSPNKPNEVAFPVFSKVHTIPPDELISVVPSSGFYLTSINFTDGIQVTLEGPVKDLRTGPGVADMRSIMPTLLDRYQNQKGVLALIPAFVAFVIGLLEKIKLLPGSQS
jgi:hypothetical protein